MRSSVLDGLESCASAMIADRGHDFAAIPSLRMY